MLHARDICQQIAIITYGALMAISVLVAQLAFRSTTIRPVLRLKAVAPSAREDATC